MVAIASSVAPAATTIPVRHIGVVPTVDDHRCGGGAGVVLDSVVHRGDCISSIPSGIGFALAVVVFIYMMRGVG